MTRRLAAILGRVGNQDVAFTRCIMRQQTQTRRRGINEASAFAFEPDTLNSAVISLKAADVILQGPAPLLPTGAPGQAGR